MDESGWECPKCGGRDSYQGFQVMNSGGANWATKRVRVVTCRKCDIPMGYQQSEPDRKKMVWKTAGWVLLFVPLLMILMIWIMSEIYI